MTYWSSNWKNCSALIVEFWRIDRFDYIILVHPEFTSFFQSYEFLKCRISQRLIKNYKCVASASRLREEDPEDQGLALIGSRYLYHLDSKFDDPCSTFFKSHTWRFENKNLFDHLSNICEQQMIDRMNYIILFYNNILSFQAQTIYVQRVNLYTFYWYREWKQ